MSWFRVLAQRPRYWPLALLLLLAALAVPGLDRHLRAAGVLLRLDADADGALAGYRRQSVSSEEWSFGALQLRSYRPEGRVRGQIVLAHGMHPRGFDEERLVALARSFTAAGLVVHTPNLHALQQLSLDSRTIDDLNVTVREVCRREKLAEIGTIGISFAGGFALLAAAREPRRHAFLAPIGAPHDLSRVVRWFAGDEAIGPSGQVFSSPPHPYGVGLLVHAEPERFFPEKDVARADAALTLALQNDWAGADRLAKQLPAASQVLLKEARSPGRPTSFREPILRLLEERESLFASASPRGHLAQLRAPVLVLHGAEDPIIPPTEAGYLRQELPDGSHVLVSVALRHAETADAGFGDNFELIHFMASVLAQAEK